MAHAPIWKSRPIFITSTFQDMQAERSHLRDLVLPRLEEGLRQKRQHLEWIDLRVGVPGAEIADESEREVSVLKVCFEGVKRSRPFLIVLIGDRYGWIPPKERAERAVAEAGFTTAFENRSVTDLEIDFGAFFDSDQAKRCLFFFRKSLPYEKMGAAAGKYSDADAAEFDAAEKALRKAKREALIERIKNNFPDHWFEYDATWDGKAVSGLDAFGNLVEEKIQDVLEAEYAAGPAPAADLSPEDLDRLELADFAEDRAHQFVGREGLLADLERHITSEAKEGAPWGLCITGEAGSGKSALFGALYQGLTHTDKAPLTEHFQALDVLVLAHAAGASPRAASVDAMLTRWIGELAAFLGVATNLPETPKPDDIDAAFASLLGRVALKQRVVVLLDALDQFELTARGRFVTWLPKLWHENARLIATAIPGDASEALTKRPAITLKPIPPLEETDARRIVANISKHYGRTLEPKVVAALAGDASERWRNPLWLTLATEEVNLVDADDFARAAEFKGSEAEKLRDMMTATARDLPADVPGLYHHTFAHAAELFGAPTVQAFLGLIAVGRVGWRESDFRVLLPKLTGEAWDALRFANLRRSFRGQLRRRGADQWDFTHAQMRPAVKAWLKDVKGISETTLHTVLGDHLLALPAEDQLHISETLLHLLEGEDWQTRAANYYGSEVLTAEEAAGATGVLAVAVLSGEEETARSGKHRVEELPGTFGLSDDVRGVVAYRFLFELLTEIEPQAQRVTLGRLAKSAQETFLQLSASNPGNAAWQSNLSGSWHKIGDVLVAQGNLSEALKAFRDSHTIFESLAQRGPDNVDSQQNLSISWNEIGDVLMTQGNLSEALRCFRSGLAIVERLAQADRGNARWQLGLPASYDRIGGVLDAQGNLTDALKAFHDALDIRERLAHLDPGDSDRQRDLSVSWNKIGDVLMTQGNLSEALRFFRNGLAIAERLARSDPGNAGWQYDLSVSWNKIGEALKAQGNLPEALKSFGDGLAIREHLTRGDPGNAGWQHGLSISRLKVGDVLVAQGNLPEALKSFYDGLAIFERLTRADPSNAVWQRDRSALCGRIGEMLVAQGNLPEALKAFCESKAIFERLVRDDPSNTDWQRDLSVSYDRIGNVQEAQGNLPEALKSFRDGLAINERLVKADSSNAVWQRDLSVSYARIGKVQEAQGNLPEALKTFRDGLAINERLVKADPSIAVWQRNMSLSYVRIGDVLVAQGNLPEALKAYRDGVAIKERLARIDTDNADLRRDMSVSWSKIGDLLAVQGNLLEALKLFRGALEINERLVEMDPDNVSDKQRLYILYIKTGNACATIGRCLEALEISDKGIAMAECLDSANVDHAYWCRELMRLRLKVCLLLEKKVGSAEAIEELRKTVKYIEKTLSSGLDDIDIQNCYAISLCQLGDFLLDNSNFCEALASFRKGESLLEHLAAVAPNESKWKMALLQARDRIGDVLVRQNVLSDALEVLVANIGVASSLVDADCSNLYWQDYLASLWVKISKIHKAMGNSPEEIKASRKVLEIRERSARLEQNSSKRLHDLVVAYDRVGDLLYAKMNLEEALNIYRSEDTVCESLVLLDGTNDGWQEALLISKIKVAEISLILGCVTEARLAAEKACSIAKKRAEYFSGERNTSKDLEHTLNLLNRCSRGMSAEVENRTAPVAGTKPSNLISRCREMLHMGSVAQALEVLAREGDQSAICHELIGVCHLRLGHNREALSALKDALLPKGEINAPVVSSSRIIANYATAQLVTGDVRGAKNTLKMVRKIDNPAVSRLLTAIDSWERSLSFAERLKWRLGGATPKPFHLDPPYGEI